MWNPNILEYIKNSGKSWDDAGVVLHQQIFAVLAVYSKVILTSDNSGTVEWTFLKIYEVSKFPMFEIVFIV